MPHPDYEKYAQNGMSAENLAQTFLRTYFAGTKPIYPLNPFQMLRDMGVIFSFRPFEKYEGMYIPADDEMDVAIVGINSDRPITRQRFTAAHELCHHIKDANSSIGCTSNPQSAIERYAEDFAAELLMPSKELMQQVSQYAGRSSVEFSDVLKIAEYFGVSFQACLNKIAWRLHRIEGDISSEALDKRRSQFKPTKRRRAAGFNDVKLYEQYFDAASDLLKVKMTPRARQHFKTEYVFHDSRMEGIDIGIEQAAEVIVDLNMHGSNSEYCHQDNQNIIEVAGLNAAYDYVFDVRDNPSHEINIYEAKKINEKLFSTAPYPELGGNYRESNTLVLGAKFETIDYGRIPIEMHHLDSDIQGLLNAERSMAVSKYIEEVLHIHYRLTVIHAFRDGNGRTIRAFTNMLLARKGLPPLLFKSDEKDAYRKSLATIDATSDYSQLYEIYFKALIQSHIELSVL